MFDDVNWGDVGKDAAGGLHLAGSEVADIFTSGKFSQSPVASREEQALDPALPEWAKLHSGQGGALSPGSFVRNQDGDATVYLIAQDGSLTPLTAAYAAKLHFDPANLHLLPGPAFAGKHVNPIDTPPGSPTGHAPEEAPADSYVLAAAPLDGDPPRSAKKVKIPAGAHFVQHRQQHYRPLRDKVVAARQDADHFYVQVQGGDWYVATPPEDAGDGRAQAQTQSSLRLPDGTIVPIASQGDLLQRYGAGIHDYRPDLVPANSLGGEPQGPWWQGLSPTEIAAEVVTPPRGGGKTEGLVWGGDLQQRAGAGRDLGVAWSQRSDFDVLPPGDKARAIAKAHGYDYDDVADYPVYATGQGDVPGKTLYYLPVAGGSRAGNVYYAAVRFHPERALANGTSGAAPRRQVYADKVAPPAVPGPPAWELTIYAEGRRVFTAKSAQESADLSGPHPGTCVAGDGQWEKAAGTQTPEALGLPKRLLAWQPDGRITPATEEYRSLQQAAQGQGPAAHLAQQALSSIGVLGP